MGDEPSAVKVPVTWSALPGKGRRSGGSKISCWGMNGGHPEDGRSGGRQPPPNKGSSPDLLGALPSGRYPLFVSRFIDVNGFGAGKFGFSPGRTRSGKTSPVFPRSGLKRENLPAAPSPTPRRNPRAAGNRRPRPAVETGGSAAGGTGDAAGRRPFGAPGQRPVGRTGPTLPGIDAGSGRRGEGRTGREDPEPGPPRACAPRPDRFPTPTASGTDPTWRAGA